MRALYKAISAPRVRRASSKGGGGYTCQSGSGWDEFTKRLTSECLGWMRQQRVSSFQREEVGAQSSQPLVRTGAAGAMTQASCCFLLFLMCFYFGMKAFI